MNLNYIFLLFFAFTVWVLYNFSKLKEAHRKLSKRLDMLEKNMSVKAEPIKQPSQSKTTIQEQKIVQKIPEEKTYTPPASPSVPPSALMTWVKENWTVVAGSIFILFGLVSAVLYLSFMIGGMARVGLLVLLACLILAVVHKFKENPVWETACGWLQGVSGGIFMTAGIGSGYITGLQWVHDPYMAMGLTVLAIFINVALAFMTHHTWLATYHLTLGVFAIIYPVINGLIEPKYSTEIFIICSALTCVCLIATHIRQWMYSGMWALSLFSIFNFLWVNQFGTSILPAVNILCIVLVSITALSYYYRAVFLERPQMDFLPLILHITGWAVLGLSLIPYQIGLMWTSYLLGGISLCVGAISYTAYKKNCLNLFRTDFLVAQLLMSYALYTWSFHHYGTSFDTIFLSFLIVQGITSTLLLACLSEKILFIGFGGFTSILLLCLLERLERIDTTLFIGIITILISCRFINLWIRQNTLSKIYTYFSDLWFLVISTLLMYKVFQFPQASLYMNITLTALVSIYLFSFKFIEREDDWKGYVAYLLLITHSFGGLVVYDPTISMVKILPLFAIPLIGFLIATFHFSRIVWVKTFCSIVVLFTSLALYYIFSSISDFIPGLIMFAASYGFYEIYHMEKYKKPIIYYLGVLSLISFVVLHIFLHLSNYSGIWGINYHFIFGAAGVALTYFWLQAKPPHEDNQSDYFLQDGLLELSIGFTLLTIFIEVAYIWHPLVYALLGMLMTKRIETLPERAKIYVSLLIFVASANIIAVNRFWDSPVISWHNSVWLASLASIGTLVSLVWYHLEKYSTPKNPTFWEKWQPEINVLSVYAMSLMFLYDYSSRTLLSLGWICLATLLAGSALYLRRPMLLKVSYATIILCLIRIVAFDLSSQALLERALVLCVSGGLLIVIHLGYKKFSKRLENNNE